MHKFKFLVWFFLIFSQVVLAQESPMPMLESSTNNIIEALNHNKGNLKNDYKIINQAITLYLLPHVDIQGMSRSVLGRQVWGKISNTEKKEFTSAFTKLVIRTYAIPLAEYSGEKVKFKPIRGEVNTKFIRVDSVVLRPNGQKIPLTYSLVSKKDGWKIYDLSVDGVSLLQSFHSQFNESLKTVSMPDLIKQMNQNKKAA